MFKQAIAVLTLATYALASEQKQEYKEYNDPQPAPQAHHSGYYYPYYGYYPYYHPAPYYYHPGYYGSYYPAYVPYDHHYQPHQPGHYGQVFIGKFEGTCRGVANGIYYVDDRSFASCSNEIKTIQSCADGSANPPYSKFEKGRYYQLAEFCSVNLVAHQKVPGYTAHQAAEVKQQDQTSHY